MTAADAFADLLRDALGTAETRCLDLSGRCSRCVYYVREDFPAADYPHAVRHRGDVRTLGDPRMTALSKTADPVVLRCVLALSLADDVACVRAYDRIVRDYGSDRTAIAWGTACALLDAAEADVCPLEPSEGRGPLSPGR